jgi:hypothetical protein
MPQQPNDPRTTPRRPECSAQDEGALIPHGWCQRAPPIALHPHGYSYQRALSATVATPPRAAHTPSSRQPAERRHRRPSGGTCVGRSSPSQWLRSSSSTPSVRGSHDQNARCGAAARGQKQARRPSRRARAAAAANRYCAGWHIAARYADGCKKSQARWQPSRLNELPSEGGCGQSAGARSAQCCGYGEAASAARMTVSMSAWLAAAAVHGGVACGAASRARLAACPLHEPPLCEQWVSRCRLHRWSVRTFAPESPCDADLSHWPSHDQL